MGAFCSTRNQPEWIKAQYFVWTSSIGYEVLYPNGAYLMELVTSWMQGTVEGKWADECLEEIKVNEYQDNNTWWLDVSMTGYYEQLVHFPSAFWSGWYDIFLVGNLGQYSVYITQYTVYSPVASPPS